MYLLLNKLIEIGFGSQKFILIEKLFQRIKGLRRVYTLFLILTTHIFVRRKGVRVMDELWDYLIVLDACRFDTFENLNDIKGELTQVLSRGPQTPVWIKYNLKGEHTDTICIGANSWCSELMLKKAFGYNPFAYVDRVWQYGWDDKLGTVPPQEVTKAAKKAIRKYPNKRAIIFYLQPHQPFIGRKRLEFKGQACGGTHNWHYSVWDALQEGKLSISEVKEAYEDNLRLVLEEVRKLLKGLNGRVIITADHGNCFGELFIYAHPRVWCRPLLEVPWFVVDDSEKGGLAIPGERNLTSGRFREMYKIERVRSKLKRKL